MTQPCAHRTWPCLLSDLGNHEIKVKTAWKAIIRSNNDIRIASRLAWGIFLVYQSSIVAKVTSAVEIAKIETLRCLCLLASCG